ncbi:MAG: acyl-CoA dehydrogenase family protein [Pseudomonadales bacterium]
MRNQNTLEMNFSDEQAMLLDSARDFCRDHSSIAQVRELLDSDAGFNNDVWQQMVALGWLGIAVPEEFGGSALGVGSTVPIAETMGRHLLSTPFFSSTLVAQTLLRAGTPVQQENWLPKLVEGEIATLALLENEDWGDATLHCTASQQNDELHLSGSKMFVADAAQAQLFVVSVMHNNAPALVLLSADQLPKDAIQTQILIDETKRSATIDFSGVIVSKAALLDTNKTVSALNDIKLLGALLIAAEATGSSAAALDCIVDYLKTRKQFGKYIGSYQALKHPTVDILNQVDSSRSLIYHAASVCGSTTLDADAEIACRMAKAQATDTLLFAGDRAVQFHGGMGFTYECDAQLYIRRAQWSQQQFGDAYHHRKRLASLILDQQP